MFAPGLMLILDSAMAILVPILLIGRMNRQLLPAPGSFPVLPAVTVRDCNRRLEPVSFAIRDRFGALNAGPAEAIAGGEAVKANVRERCEWPKFTGAARKFHGAATFAAVSFGCNGGPIKRAGRIIVMERRDRRGADHAGLPARGGHYATLYNTYFRRQTPDYRPG